MIQEICLFALLKYILLNYKYNIERIMKSDFTQQASILFIIYNVKCKFFMSSLPFVDNWCSIKYVVVDVC